MASKQKSSRTGRERRTATNGRSPSTREELAQYLEGSIKPGLNAGAIPPLARSIARDIAAQEPPRSP